MALSKRTQVKRQVKFAAHHIDAAMNNLQQVHIIADGHSDKIDKSIPPLVVLLETMRKLLEQFRMEL